MLFVARESRVLSSSAADKPVDENDNFSAPEPSQAKVGGISADRVENHWVRNKNVGSNFKRAGGVTVLVKVCSSCLGCRAGMISVALLSFCILFFIIIVLPLRLAGRTAEFQPAPPVE